MARATVGLIQNFRFSVSRIRTPEQGMKVMATAVEDLLRSETARLLASDPPLPGIPSNLTTLLAVQRTLRRWKRIVTQKVHRQAVKAGANLKTKTSYLVGGETIPAAKKVKKAKVRTRRRSLGTR
jgi:hypothetical protein